MPKSHSDGVYEGAAKPSAEDDHADVGNKISASQLAN